MLAGVSDTGDCADIYRFDFVLSQNVDDQPRQAAGESMLVLAYHLGHAKL